MSCYPYEQLPLRLALFGSEPMLLMLGTWPELACVRRGGLLKEKPASLIRCIAENGCAVYAIEASCSRGYHCKLLEGYVR